MFYKSGSFRNSVTNLKITYKNFKQIRTPWVDYIWYTLYLFTGMCPELSGHSGFGNHDFEMFKVESGSTASTTKTTK